MSMQQPSKVQLGQRGQTAVIQFFEDLGWGPLPTGVHDLGTDLYVQLRKDDLVDLGTLLGVQVKTGDDFFSEPTTVNGRNGWWFRESHKRHKGYWIDHHVPHILIIQDEARVRRFWAWLDKDSVQSTGKGIRVFVPEEQALIREFAPDWTTVVTNTRKTQSLEGARWSFDVSDLPESEWARYALLASRIVSPHPNQGVSRDINWAEAIALCLQAEPRRWHQLAAERKEVPTPSEARLSTNAGWNFAAAVHDWMTGDNGHLQSLAATSLPEDLRIPHAICLSLALRESGDRSGAITVLQSLRSADGTPSVDQAWLAVHLGWSLYESGCISEGRQAFEESVSMHASFPSSLTNSAIRSAGILALFNTTPLGARDIATAAQALDSTHSWWQNQQISVALNDFLRRSFLRWGHDSSVTIGDRDTTNDALVSAERTAQLIGDQRASKYAALLRGMANLTLPKGDHVTVEEELETLRAAGHHKELALALRRLRNEGPLQSVSRFMAGVRVSSSTTTSVNADLVSLRIGGAYLPSSCAREWTDYLFQTFEDPSEFMRRFNIGTEVRHLVLDAIAGLRLQFREADEEQLIEIVLKLPAETTQLLERHLRFIFSSFTPAVLEANAGSIASRGRLLPADAWLGQFLTEQVAQISSQAREEVKSRILNGNLTDVPPDFPVGSFEQSEADAIIAQCERKLQEFHGRFNQISFGVDPYLMTSKFAIFGPEASKSRAWEVVIEEIAAENVFQERKTDTLRFLSANAGLIPEEHREALLQASIRFRMTEGTKLPLLLGGLSPSGPAFTELFLELHSEDDAWHEALAGLLAGGAHERLSGTLVLSRRAGHELLLLALTQDGDVRVARSAVRGLARRAAEDSAVARVSVQHLLSLIHSRGEQAPFHVGDGISVAQQQVPEIAPLVAALKSHESLQIRNLAEDL